jgi:hypothetical protein
MKPKDILTKELLELEYIQNKMSILKIARKYNIPSTTSVSQALDRFELKRERIHKGLHHVTKEWLYEKYVTENLSLRSINKLLGRKNRSDVSKLLKKYEIPIRENSDTKIWRDAAFAKRSFGELTGQYVSLLRSNADLRDLKFEVTGEFLYQLYLDQDKKCALSGVDIYFKAFGTDRTTQTASLDRIDSCLDYTEDNVQWVHKHVNRMKWDTPNDEFIEWCKNIAETNK